MKLSVIVPCYNEQETVVKFYDAVLPVVKDIPDCSYELIFVNDGSRDKTEEILSSLAEADKNVKTISFSRNFGQQAAILCGFRECTGDCAVELDCDLQDPVEVIPEMVAKWREGYDVVHGRRTVRRGETMFKKVTASLYYKRLAKISSVDIPRNTGDFKLLDRKVIYVIIDLHEHNKYLRGLESWVGFKQTFVDYERKERVAGKTHYTLKKMFNLAKSGVISNSNHPLSLSLKIGAAGLVLSILCFIAFIVLSIVGVTLETAVWLFPAIAFVGSGLLLANAVTNMYIEKIYDEVKNRPEYLIKNKKNFDE